MIKEKSSVPFYVTGGTLSRDALSYVVRKADDELYEGLMRCDFCYVLTSRQMGKSSLMVRTASRLRDARVGVVLLDLTAIGQNLTAEQWYSGLLTQIGQQLDLEDELDEFWDSRPKLGPLQRWMQAIRRVLLPHYPGNVVVFIDEIDAVRSLPFSTDEFFAAIREFYNRRSEDEDLRRLTFCLLGVAAPSDLIRDTRTTPFNIGRRVELHDFTESEAASLAKGLRQSSSTGKALLKRVIHWTSGHPYLTQRLCQAVADEAREAAASEVDHLCHDLFLSHQAQERDDNLLFVRERLLRTDANRADLLALYAKLLERNRVHDDVTNPLINVLRLSGITRVDDGALKVRNRIYESVFGREWVKENMPDAELRRQREAYRRGLLRAAAIAAVIIAAIGGLAFAALWQRNRASAEARRADVNYVQASRNADEAKLNLSEAERQRTLAEERRGEALNQKSLAEEQRDLAELQRERAELQEQSNRQLLYSAQMNLAYRDWDGSNIERARELLSFNFPKPGQADLRGFEWYLLWSLSHSDLFTVYTPREPASIAFSPDGKIIAAAEDEGDQQIRLWDASSGRALGTLKQNGIGKHIAFSRDGKLLATIGKNNSVVIWDVYANKEIRSLRGHLNNVNQVAFSPDGKTLASAGDDKSVKLWRADTGELLADLKSHAGEVYTVSFSADGRKLASGGRDESVKIWDVETRKELLTVKEHPIKGRSSNPEIFQTLFSPDGKKALAIGNFMGVAIWDASTGKIIQGLPGHRDVLSSMAFSPDGKLFATGSSDRTVLLWNVDDWKLIAAIKGHAAMINSIAFSPDSRMLATASGDYTIKFWKLDAPPQTPLARGYNGGVGAVVFSRDGSKLFAGVGKDIQLLDAGELREISALKGHKNAVISLAVSTDGKTIASASFDKTAKLWDLATSKELLTLKGHTDNVNIVAFSPDGKTIATGGEDSTLRLWDVATGRETAVIRDHKAPVMGAAFSPNGKLLATGSSDGMLRIWDPSSRKAIAVIDGRSGRIYRVAFSPDGKILATASSDRTIKLWDVASWKELRTLKGHANFVIGVAFSPDGRRLVSSGADFSVRIWDVGNGQELASLRNYRMPIWGLAFSPDGNSIATGANNGVLYLWRAATAPEVLARRR